MWNEICEKIFSQTIIEFEKNNIKYFILRNYEGLPADNKAKDVDIVIEPGKLKQAKQILLDAYKNNGCDHYYEAVFHKLHCLHGISITNKLGIHIDLIEGYLAKGYEVFTFEEMYENVIKYNNICVLGEVFESIVLLVYKLFGYKKPQLREDYRDKLYNVCTVHTQEFCNELAKITNEKFATKIVEKILQQDFETVIKETKQLTKLLKKYIIRKRPLKTFLGKIAFVWGKISRIIICYRKHARVIGVIAPDGAGKTTFIDNIVEQINFYYVNDADDKRCDVRHFRPNILPNLGELGEKAGMMEQDKEWSKPHRGKPASSISSLFRMAYYMLDYILGWQKLVRKNVQYDRFTIFDRYSYDFIVDPRRSKINLPQTIRKILVSLTPKPKLVFVLVVEPETIYERKQELSLEEINRQCSEYRKLAKKHKRFVEIDASEKPIKMAEDAIEQIINIFTDKL